MPDMLVKLYDLPDSNLFLSNLRADGIVVRRTMAAEKHVVINWIRERFTRSWADQCEAAFANKPPSCFVAIENETMIGFACYDATYRNFFGPTAVSESAQGRDVGKALLLISLRSMAEQGYAYAIIGGVGPVEFYAKVAGAVIIEGSEPGIYRGVLIHPVHKDENA